MAHTSTKSETLSADGEMPIRLVTITGIPYWQSHNGRTFPQVAGAEDPPGDTDTDKDGTDEDADTADDYDKDRAFRTIQKQRADLKAAREREKAAAKERDELRAKQKQAEDADLSETERLRNRTAELEREKTDLERERQETRNVHAIERAAAKLGAADPEDVYRLLDTAQFEHDADGNVTNADKLVGDLLKRKPYLAGKTTSGVPGTPRSNGTQSHEDRVKENRDKLRASGLYEPLG